MAVIHTEEFIPEPFPEGLRTVELETISLTKLLNDDAEEAHRLFHICTHEGFCYIDLTTHPKGLRLLSDAHEMHRVGVEAFQTPMAEKFQFKTRGYEHGYLDTGYQELGLGADGNCNRLELLNISQAEFFSEQGDGKYDLPPWLAKHEIMFRTILRDANVIHNIILAILERELALPIGALTSLHRLTDPSGDFLRVLHYPAPKDGKPLKHPPTPAHRDAVSVALLFCWQGGLQITDSDAAVDHTVEEPEDSWYWVKPKTGHVIMNLGLALQVLTNGVLKAGKHRVVTPPGKQALHDRYSVLVSARPHQDAPMRSFKSPRIPVGEFEEGDTLTALQWSIKQVLKTVHNIRRNNNEPLNQ